MGHYGIFLLIMGNAGCMSRNPKPQTLNPKVPAVQAGCGFSDLSGHWRKKVQNKHKNQDDAAETSFVSTPRSMRTALPAIQPWAERGSGGLGALGFRRAGDGSFRKLGVPYFGILIVRILLFRGTVLGSPIFRNSQITA